MERKRTPAEIREEYERLQKEREERRLQQRTNPKVLSITTFHCVSRACHCFYADVIKYPQLNFNCGRFPHSFHYVAHLHPSLLINSVSLAPSHPHYSGHHQCWCRCNRPVWSLWWGLWRDARGRLSSYWNQQDAHFSVHRGITAHSLSICLPELGLHSFYVFFFSGSSDKHWHSSAVWFTLHSQWERRGKH